MIGKTETGLNFGYYEPDKETADRLAAIVQSLPSLNLDDFSIQSPDLWMNQSSQNLKFAPNLKNLRGPVLYPLIFLLISLSFF